jgi:hypothetical protein
MLCIHIFALPTIILLRAHGNEKWIFYYQFYDIVFVVYKKLLL